MTVNEWSLRIGALLVSLLVHGLLFFNTGSTAGNNEQQPPKRTVTHLSFRSVAAPQTPPQPQPEVPVKKPPEPEVTEAPEPPPKPQPAKKEKRAKKAHQPKPLPQSAPEKEVKAAEPTTEEAEKTPEVPEAVAGTVQDPALIKKAKQEYLRRLMAHIESHKEYPRAARRRRIEGDVRVEFSLLEGGRITGLKTTGGHRLLSDATRQAVEQAVPMPAPPDSMPLPWQITFTMRFSLN